MLTIERLRKLLDYNQLTGIFSWREQRQHIKAGSVAGCLKKSGYVEIKIDGVNYQAHRLAWFHVHGEMPEELIDHENLIKKDNKFLNLRKATPAQNLRNRIVRRDSGTGLKGVYVSSNRFKAQITVDGRRINLGSFATPEEAACAYAKAAKEHHKEFSRTRA